MISRGGILVVMVAVVAHWLVGLILLVIHILSHTLKCQQLLFLEKKFFSEKIGDVKNTLVCSQSFFLRQNFCFEEELSDALVSQPS